MKNCMDKISINEIAQLMACITEIRFVDGCVPVKGMSVIHVILKQIQNPPFQMCQLHSDHVPHVGNPSLL